MSATSESSVSPTPPKRERLLSRWHLVFVAMVGLLALAMVAPSSRMLENTSVRPDRLSLQYLRLMTAMRPNDMGLKLHLARVLLALNQLDEANKLVDAARATTDPQLRLWAWRLGLQIHIAQFTGDPNRATRDPQLVQGVAQDIQSLLGEPLSPDELSGLAASSLIIGRPDLAARIYLRLAEVDRKQRSKWLAAAAQQTLASGQPAAAGVLYDELAQSEQDPSVSRLYALQALNALTSANQSEKALAVANRYAVRFKDDTEILDAAAQLALANGQPLAASRHYDNLVDLTKDPEKRRRYAKMSVMAMTAANHPESALPSLRRYVQEMPQDAQLLDIGVKLAMAGKQPRLAQEWGRELLKQDPNNGMRIASQLDIELAAGDQAAALALARRMVARRPGDLKARERLAQLADWNNHPREALEAWAYLALHTNNPKFFDRALKMAPQLYEQELLAKLLARKAERGRMTDAELLTFVQVFEDIGDPEQLVQLLDAYLARFPDHLEAWQALALVHERRGDLPGAVATWERISRDFGSNTKETTHRAELLWEQNKTEQAYVLLRDTLDHAGVATTHELLTRTEIALMPASPLEEEKPDPKSKDENGRKAFLKLLGQLFWFAEPRPETIDNYRTLWREEAMTIESAERYILLAKTEGKFEEAISIGEAAFKRFNNPEFLMTAMDLAYNNQRWADLGHLIDVAHSHAALFAENKHYYLILAEYYSHLGDYERAQQVYLRIIALDPNSVAARANLLWLLIEHADDRPHQRGKRHRRLLANLLTNWRQLAVDQPSLWLPFANGYSLLGRSKDAVSWYGREWTERPTDHLWLVGYVSTLEALSRDSDVHRLRRFALESLRPQALRAAHRGATPGEREVLKAYVELVRDVYGAGKGSRWLTQVLHSDLDPAVQKGLFAVWRNNGESAEPSYWVNDTSSEPRRNPWGRFPKAPKPGQDQQQATIADASASPQESEEPAPAPLLVLAQDAAAGEDTVPANLMTASVDAGVQSVNDLLIMATSVAAQLAHGAWALGGHLGVHHLFFGNDEDPQAAATDVDLGAYGMYRHSLGRLEVGIGGNLRADASMFTGYVSESFRLWKGGTLQLGVHINELAFDTRWLRIYAARHHATMSLSTSFLTDGILNIKTDFYHYHTRTNEEIGAGFSADADLGYRIRRVQPLWTVRLSGSWTRNFHLTDRLPSFGSGSSSGATLLDALPLEFAAVGVGTRIEHRFPGVTPIGAGRWRYLGDVWVGWMWPVNIVGFEIHGGVGLALPRKQEISLTGFVANNRWLGPGVVNAGLSLRYLFH